MNRYDDGDYLIDGVGFASPGSALRAATRRNPRNQPCPDRKSTRLNSSHSQQSRMPSSA